MLNVAAGTEDYCVVSDIADANTWLMTNPLGSGVKANSEEWKDEDGSSLHSLLGMYNEGDRCAPASPVLARAWIEKGGAFRTYDPSEGDLLIAQFEDVDQSGDPTPGDIIRTDRYPTAVAGSSDDEFTMKKRVLDAGDPASFSYVPRALTVETTGGDRYRWGFDDDDGSSGFGLSEFYSESNDVGDQSIVVDRFTSLGDFVDVETNSPSIPATNRSDQVDDPSDQAFIQVEITPPPLP